MATVLAPSPILQFEDSSGKPLSGGLLFTYEAGTTTKATTYTDSSGTTPNTNPIVLNLFGVAEVWIPPQVGFKFVLSPAGDSDPPTNSIWTVDNIISPTVVTGTIANQDSSNVDITGGTISVAQLACTGTTRVGVMQVSGNININNSNSTLNTPSVTINVDGASGGLNMTGQTNYAAAGTGTLTNSVAGGNPGFWLRVNINNTAYAIPAWKI